MNDMNDSKDEFCSPLQVKVLGLDATSQASKQFAWLSGGTPLALAAFVGDEAGVLLGQTDIL